MRKRKPIDLILRLASIVGLLAAVAVFMATDSGKGAVATSTSWGHINHKGDSFFTYDFTGTSPEDFDIDKGWAHVDWPLTILFIGFSSEHVVKNLFDPWLSSTGSAMNALVNNGAGWSWDDDKGRKEGSQQPIPWPFEGEIPCPSGDLGLHYRIYGPNGHSFRVTGNWNFYNIASAHFDSRECSLSSEDQWAGASEVAERAIAGLARKRLGKKRVEEDRLDWGNVESLEMEEGSPDHLWQSDGQTTIICIPQKTAEEL